jgi:hypothetical protein
LSVDLPKDRGVLFVALTPLGFAVRVTSDRWTMIATVKHPVMSGLDAQVHAALEAPDEIRQSRTDSAVLLFYKLEKPGRWICAVVKRLASDAFLITAYPTDAIKEGARVWPN